MDTLNRNNDKNMENNISKASTEREKLDFINEECITNYTSLDEVDWDYISCYNTLSENFIREFQDYVDWCNISEFQTLSESFIREFKDKVNWGCIILYQKLSEDFIREFQNKVEWSMISMYQTLSEDFIREFQDKVYWYNISYHQKLSEDFIREFKNKVDWDCISRYQILSEDFIKEFADNVVWTKISTYQILSEDFIREFQDKVNWDCITHHQTLSEDFIREFKDKVDWIRISIFHKLSEDFIREFQDKVHWDCISKCQKLSEDFIQEFKELMIEDNDNQDITLYETVSIEPFESKDDNNKHEEILNITFTEEELLEKLKNPELPKLISDIQDLESTVEKIKIDCFQLDFSNLEIKYKGNNRLFSDEKHNIINFDNKIFTESELEDIISLLVECYNSKLDELKKQYLNIFYGNKFKTEITE